MACGYFCGVLILFWLGGRWGGQGFLPSALVHWSWLKNWLNVFIFGSFWGPLMCVRVLFRAVSLPGAVNHFISYTVQKHNTDFGFKHFYSDGSWSSAHYFFELKSSLVQRWSLTVPPNPKLIFVCGGGGNRIIPESLRERELHCFLCPLSGEQPYFCREIGPAVYAFFW